MAKVADADAGERTVVDLIRERSLRPRRQHAAGLGRPRRRLPDPRGGARRPRAVHHDDLRRRRGGARDRQRPRRDGAVAAGAHRHRVTGVVTTHSARARASASRCVGRERSGRTRCCGSSAAGSTPACPGQFFMLEAPGPRAAAADVALPRAARRARLPDRPDRARHARARRRSAPGERDPRARAARERLRPRRCERPLLVGGGIGIAPFPYLSERLGGPPALLGFRSAAPRRGGRARPGRRGRPRARRSSPTRCPPIRATCSRCGPGADARGRARGSCRSAQLAWEAPMACGYGACYGCVVEIDGRYRRLCVAGPRAARPRGRAAW